MTYLMMLTAERSTTVEPNPVPAWLQIGGAYRTAFGAIFTAFGVLVALWAAFYWELFSPRAIFGSQ
jgi:hypothetical protein